MNIVERKYYLHLKSNIGHELKWEEMFLKFDLMYMHSDSIILLKDALVYTHIFTFSTFCRNSFTHVANNEFMNLNRYSISILTGQSELRSSDTYLHALSK